MPNPIAIYNAINYVQIIKWKWLIYFLYTRQLYLSFCIFSLLCELLLNNINLKLRLKLLTLYLTLFFVKEAKAKVTRRLFWNISVKKFLCYPNLMNYYAFNKLRACTHFKSIFIDIWE